MPLLPETPIRFLKQLLWWLPATARWLWEGKRFWAPPLVAVAICVLVAAAWPCVEQKVRLAGMVLQLFGVSMIVLRLHAAQRQFPGQTLTRWLQRRPPFMGQNRVISPAAGTLTLSATGKAQVRVSPGSQATLEQRLAMLEDSYTKLFDEVGGLEIEITRRSEELSNKLHAEVAAREANNKRIEEQLKETAVGSLHLDAWGVLFFILGIFAGTASPEIAAALGAASCK